MKKRNLFTLALLGISLSLFGDDKSEPTGDQKAFYSMLKPDAQEKFLELDEEHRKAAMAIYHSNCKGGSQCGGPREEAVEEQYKNQKQQRESLNNENFNKKK